MTRYVVAATEADGRRLGEDTVSVAPTPAEAAEFGDRHQADYVSVRHDDDITLYGRDAAGRWSVLITDAPAPVVVEVRREHDARNRPGTTGDHGRRSGPIPEGDYVLTAIDVDGEPFGQSVTSTAPTPAEAAEFGALHEADYVIAGREDGDTVTLYGRDAGDSWWVVSADLDPAIAEEVCLWFDLTQHYHGSASADIDPGRPADRPLAHVPAPDEGRHLDETRAISMVVRRIRSRGLDYPTQGLVADRFAAGWSVYAPVDVDESDPMAFLDMPVARSVFLVSDLGRVKEISSSIPPQQACDLFAAEEAFVRRLPAEEQFMADLRDEVMRGDAGPDGPGGISDFTIVAPPGDAIAARASGLLDPIAQQLAPLGPPGWERFTAVFSFTLSAEIARLHFWSAGRHSQVPVPEQIAILVRRQRHLAARMPAGPWCRLLLTVTHSAGTSAQITTEYDYGDEPLPDEHLLSPEHYRDDLAVYPRSPIPGWLAAYTRENDPGSSERPSAPAPERDEGPRPPAPRQPVPAPPSAGPQPQQRTDIPARITKIGNDEGLGALWGVYPGNVPPGSRLWGLGLGAGVCAVLGLVMLATHDALGVVLLVIAAVLALFLPSALRASSQNPGKAAATFEFGLVAIDQENARVFRWPTTAVRQRIVEHKRNGVHERTTHHYHLTGPDGQELSLGDDLVDPEKWGREIQEGVTRARLPVALRTVAGGGTVDFGPIAVDAQGVTAKARSVPWSDIEQIKVVQGHVSLRVAGKWLPLIHTEVSRIPNFFVFFSLAEHLRVQAHGG